MHSKLEFDLIVNGGGLAGASLALDLAHSGFRVALIDVESYQIPGRSGMSSRAIALTYSSGIIFRRLGLWEHLPVDDITAIRQTEVTDSSMKGLVQLRASDVGYDELGWNIEARVIHEQLYRCLDESESVSIFSPAELTELTIDDSLVSCNVVSRNEESTQALNAKILVIADGGKSGLADRLGFADRRRDYDSCALVCRVETDRPNRQTAYEHFVRTGPLALLPTGDCGYSVVWTLEPKESERLKVVTSEQFLEALQEIFSDRVGKFVELAGERQVYPLKYSMLKEFIRPRVVVIGNAMHTFHPVAGQGFNLALRETTELVEILARYRDRGWDIGCYDALEEYQNRRKRESLAVGSFTDGLIRIFANDSSSQSRLRNIGLDVIQAIAPIKRMLLMRTMGLHRLSPPSMGQDSKYEESA